VGVVVWSGFGDVLVACSARWMRRGEFLPAYIDRCIIMSRSERVDLISSAGSYSSCSAKSV
jgi:hypothetical protein